MLSPERRLRRTDREGTVSWRRIAATLLGAVAVVALAVWGVASVARTLVGPDASGGGGSRPAAAASAPATESSPATEVASVPTETPPPVATEAAPVAAKPPVTIKPKPKPKPKAPAAPKPANTGYVVVIDPGHQAHGNSALEPIGPGSSTKKPAVAGGATGVATHVPESVVNLQVSLKIRDALQARGVKVIMVRTTENVNIPNSKRAGIANAAHADLFLRVHCDSANSGSVTGFLTLVPGRNQWTGPIVTASGRAGRDIQAAAVKGTGAKNRGVTPRSDMAGFNWSRVPSVIVEMGLMSNPAEDRRLSAPSYQAKLASGITGGVMTYLAGR
jgi:N-acetylmuramoyl-L-alanine amidase